MLRVRKINQVQTTQQPPNKPPGQPSQPPGLKPSIGVTSVGPNEPVHNAASPEPMTVSELSTVEPLVDNNPISGSLTPSIEVTSSKQDKSLMRLKSVWFLDLFPNELIIKEMSVHVITREFMRSQVESMLIKDISIVTVTNGIIFSAVTISYRIPHEDFVITNVPKSQAARAKALIDSLILGKQAEPMLIEPVETSSDSAESIMSAA